jgi:hypothetical protein
LLGAATLPASIAVGFNIHPGDEFGYVLKRPLVLKIGALGHDDVRYTT